MKGSDTGGSYTYIMSKWNSTVSTSWVMSLHGDVLMVAVKNGGNVKEYESSVVVGDNKWHQVGFTFVSGTLKLYIDGVEDTSVTKVQDDVVNTIDDSTQAVLIGAVRFSGSYSAHFDGRVDQATIWSNVLSASDMLEAYNGGCPSFLTGNPKYSDLEAWWAMGDSTTYPTIVDQKGSNDGTMVNMSASDFIADSGCREL
jgi:hypothetical protein